MGHILVGVDGSAESNRAARLAKSLACATGRGLVFTHVLPMSGSLPEPDHPTALWIWQREHELRARQELEALFQGESGWGSEPEIELLEGSPAQVLAERASENDVDLVVVGHRERNPLARALLGSVADRLVQISAKPVLVVP